MKNFKKKDSLSVNFYITAEPPTRIKECISNLHKYCIVDINEILKRVSNEDVTKPHVVAYINSEIKTMLSTALANTRVEGVIYSNKRLHASTVKSLIGMSIVKDANVDKISVIDNRNVPKMKDAYSLVEEVVFISRFKKTKLQ